MAFDVEGALKAGYTQEEINQFLSQQPQEKPNFDVEGALKAGYTQEEIDQYLVTPQQPTPPQQPVIPEPVATQPKPMNFDREGALAAGYTQEEINQFLIAQGQPLRPEDTSFIDRAIESGKRGFTQFGGTATGYDVAASAIKGDAEAVAKKMAEAKAQQAQEALTAVPTFTASDIQRIFEEKGLVSAGARVPEFIVTMILENGPQMIPPIVASISATALAAPTGPFAPLIGGAAGIITYGLQQFGNFMERQALERNAPEDIDVGKAALWSAITAPIGFFADRLTLGLTKIGSKEAGKQVMKELAERQAGKVAAVKAGAAQAGKQAGVGIIAEAPTEVLEQMAERYQAGLDLTSEEAKKEYFEAFWSAAAVGGGLGTASGAYTSYRNYQNAKQDAVETTDTTVKPAKEKPSRDTLIDEEFNKLKDKINAEKAVEEEAEKAIIETTPPDIQQNSTGVLDEATLTSFGVPKKSQKKLIGLDFNNPKDVETFDTEVQNLTNLKENIINEYKLKLSDEAIKDGRLDDKRNRISYEISSGPYNAISEGAGTPLGSSVLEYTTDAGTITGRVEEPSNTLDQQVKEDNKALTKQALGIVEEPVTEEAAVEEVTETVEETPAPVVEEVNEVTEEDVTPPAQEELTAEELDARNIAIQLNALDPGNPLISELQDPFVTEDVIREAYAEVKARRDKRTADQVQQNILEKEFRLEPDEYYSFESFSNPQPEIVSTTKNNKNLGQVFNNLIQNHFNKLPLSYQNLINVLSKIPGVNGTKYRVGEFVTEKGARGKFFAQTNSTQIDPQRGNVQTILHEAVHSATVAEMRRQIKVNRNDKTGEVTYTGKTEAAKTLLNIYDAAKIAVAGTPEAGSYGLTDPFEFVAEAFSNERFQQTLANIPSVEATQPELIFENKPIPKQLIDQYRKNQAAEERANVSMSGPNKAAQTRTWQTLSRMYTDFLGVDPRSNWTMSPRFYALQDILQREATKPTQLAQTLQPSKLSTLWTDFVNSVKDLLKLKDISNTLLNDVITVSQDLFKGPDKSVFDSTDPGPVVFAQKETKKDYDALLKKATPNIEAKKKKPTGKYMEPGDDPTGFIAKYIRNFRTRAFSFDLALNQAILKSMRMQGIAKDAIAKVFYMLDIGQAVRSDDVSQSFLVNGKIDYNPTNAKVTTSKSPNSFKAIEDKIAAMAKYYGVKFEDMQQYASTAFIARRVKGLRNSNVQLRQKVANLLRKGKTAQAKNLMKKGYKLIHLTPAEEKAGLEFFKKFEKPGYNLNEVFTMWNAVRAETLKFAVESGLYSQEDAQKLLDVMDYVPFYREAQQALRENRDVVGPEPKQRGLLDTAIDKAFKGSYEQVNNVFDNMERWIDYTIQKSVKNQAAVNKIIATKQFMANEIIDLKEAPTSKKEGFPVTVWIEGKQYDFLYKQEIFQKAFTGLDPIMMPELAIFAGPVNILRQNIVLNPIFSLLQIPQDAYAAMLTSQVRYPIMLPLQVVKEIALTPLRLSKAREQLKSTAVVGRLDYTKQMEQYEAEFKKEKRKPSLAGKAWRTAVVNPLSYLSMASDNVIRQAVYSQTMLETGDARLATMRAAEIINFRRTGSSKIVNVMRQVSPFINANLQALNVVGGTLLLDGISPKTKMEALRSTLNTMMQTIPLVLIYSALMSDDEEYEKMDPAYRDNSLLIPGSLTGDIKGWTIPLRPDLFTLVSKVIPEHIFQRMVMDTEDPTKFKKALKEAFIKGVSFPTPFPTALRPIAEVYLNYDFYNDRPIVGRGLESSPTQLQYSFKNTSQLALALSKATGDAISPVKLDQFLRGYFGYTAGIVNMAFERTLADINGIVLPNRSDREAFRRIPGFSRLLSSEEGSRNINDFYELREEFNRVYNEYKAYQTNPMTSSTDMAGQFYNQEKNRKLIDLKPSIDILNDELSDMRNYENEVLASQTLTPEKKRLELKRIADLRQSYLGYNIDTPEKARRHVEFLRRKGGL